MRMEYHNPDPDTPRVQNENRVIRKQVKGLLDEAKERYQEITKLK